MESTPNIEHRELGPAALESYPVWTWDEAFEEENRICPVSNTDPLPDDLDALFVKAAFLTPAGRHLGGYVVADVDVFAVTIFLSGQKFGFNVRLTDLAMSTLRELRQAIGEEDPVFPLHFETGFRLADGKQLEGSFDVPMTDDCSERS